MATLKCSVVTVRATGLCECVKFPPKDMMDTRNIIMQNLDWKVHDTAVMSGL